MRMAVVRSIRFTKAEAAKNDFVIVHDPETAMTDDDRRGFSVEACGRRTGVGADGTIFISGSAGRDFLMSFYNPDGSYGSMCGNGGRAAALFAYSRGLARSSMLFEALGREYRAEITEAGVRLYFPPPGAITKVRPVAAAPLEGPAFFINTGAPHLVLFLDMIRGASASLGSIDMDATGRVLRNAEEFKPGGTNVNVLQPFSDGSFGIRTFEKGVEGETMSCGTGALASGLVAHAARGAASPVRLRTHGGDTLLVYFGEPTPGGGDRPPALHDPDLSLEGPARLVFEGDFPWQ